MSETRKRVVIEGYPADKLPEDLRREFEPGESLQITLRSLSKPDAWDAFLEKVRDYHRANPGQSVTSQDAVARVRHLRDEWD